MYLRKTINNKRIIEKNGEEILDLTEQNFNPKSEINVIDFFYVTSDLEMRPDLISQFSYRDVNATDIVLKQNGIRNPFTIEKGDLIFIQERNEVDRNFANSNKKEAKRDVRNQYLDPDKAPSIDNNLKSFSTRNKPKKTNKKSSEPLPPNFAAPGDQEIRLEGGKVIYGGDVSGNKRNKQEPISKSEFLRRIKRNK